MKREKNNFESSVKTDAFSKLSKFLKLSSEICQVENLENMNIQELSELKLKTINHINNYLCKCMEPDMDRLYIYSNPDKPDFQAYLALRDGKASLIFRQDEVGQAHHYYFDTAYDVLEGMQFVEKLLQKDQKAKKSL